MGAVERSLETLPTERLCLILAAQGLHHIEAYLLPFEREPAGSVFIDRVDSVPGLLGTARVQKSPRDFGRHLWHSLGALICCAMNASTSPWASAISCRPSGWWFRAGVRQSHQHREAHQ